MDENHAETSHGLESCWGVLIRKFAKGTEGLGTLTPREKKEAVLNPRKNRQDTERVAPWEKVPKTEGKKKEPSLSTSGPREGTIDRDERGGGPREHTKKRGYWNPRGAGTFFQKKPSSRGGKRVKKKVGDKSSPASKQHS